MQVVNRIFTQTGPVVPAAGVLVVPLEEAYHVELLHATYRNLSMPSRGAKRTHTHAVYHVVLVTGGRGGFVIGKEPQPVHPGQVFITSPGEWHSFGNGENESVEYCEITFECKTRAGKVLTRPFHEVLSAWTGKECPRLSWAEAGPALDLLMRQETERLVRVGFSQEPDYALFLLESLARIFLGLYTHLYRRRTAARSDPLREVHDYLHKHYREPFSLARLAELSGFTPNYVSRGFKARFGTTPLFYQQGLRMQAAADLLRTTQHPLKQIAEIVGFEDVYFFSKTFRKVHGRPPGQYRREAQARGTGAAISVLGGPA